MALKTYGSPASISYITMDDFVMEAARLVSTVSSTSKEGKAARGALQTFFSDFIETKWGLGPAAKKARGSTAPDVISTEEEVLEDYAENFETIDSMILVCPDSPYDIIVKAQIEKEETSKDNYMKEILTYKRKYHAFILSSDTEFYIDLKITNNNINSKYLAESSYLKILDIIKLFEKTHLEFKVLN
jgi:hypothetical protein